MISIAFALCLFVLSDIFLWISKGFKVFSQNDSIFFSELNNLKNFKSELSIARIGSFHQLSCKNELIISLYS